MIYLIIISNFFRPCLESDLPQDLLGRELSFKREIEGLKERLLVSERETVKVTAAAKAHRGDKVSTVRYSTAQRVTVAR